MRGGGKGAFQTKLLEHSGGGLNPPSPVGTFDFDLQPFVDRQSRRLGVHERHFTTHSRQTGNFVDGPMSSRLLKRDYDGPWIAC